MMKHQLLLWLVMLSALLTGCTSDAPADGETAMPVDSIHALLKLDDLAEFSDSSLQAPPPTAAQERQRKERDSIIQVVIPKSEVCKLTCPELLERYREAVELSISKSDDSKLTFFIENVNDPCLQACKKKTETRQGFKDLDKKLNEEAKEDIF